MIKITNKTNLPDVFYKAVKVDRHRVNGDISVTQLIDAPQIRQLKKNNDTEEDVADRIWMLFGTALHKVLELAEVEDYEARTLLQAKDILSHYKYDKAAGFINKVVEKDFKDALNPNIITEQTVTLEVLGWILSGTFDRFDIALGEIQDYKATGVYAYTNPESRKKWKQQLNIYAYMMEQLGYEVKSLKIFLLLKDWKKINLLKNKDYPPSPIVEVDIQREPNEKVIKYIEKRITLHQAADNGQHVPCTPNDKWDSPTTYAVIKKGGKKALKVFPAEMESLAYKMVEEIKYKYPKAQEPFVDVRKGGSRRCNEGYCSVASVCQQRLKELAELDKESL